MPPVQQVLRMTSARSLYIIEEKLESSGKEYRLCRIPIVAFWDPSLFETGRGDEITHAIDAIIGFTSEISSRSSTEISFRQYLNSLPISILLGHSSNCGRSYVPQSQCTPIDQGYASCGEANFRPSALSYTSDQAWYVDRHCCE